jgi:hypothetical protein
MALNRERPHLLVLPEDDATRSIAVGFADVAIGQMQVLDSARGWPHVRDEISSTFATKLRRYPHCHLVLLIDFDDDFNNRMATFRAAIPQDIANRVFVLGAYTEAETLRRASGLKFGPIGQKLAGECERNEAELWNHLQVKHNEPEAMRLRATVNHFLFRAA